MKTDKQTYILQMAKKLFCHLGIHNVTVDEIAGNCGVSKKTIYALFENKTDLVKTLFEREIFLFEMNLKDINKNSENAVIELKAFFSFLGSINIQSVIFHDLKKYYPDLYQRLLGLIDKIIRPFIEINIQRGLNERVYRKTRDLNILPGAFLRVLKLMFFDEKSLPFAKGIDIGILSELLIHYLIEEPHSPVFQPKRNSQL